MESSHTGIYEFLSACDTPVTSKEIERFLNISGEDVRFIVNSLRKKGYPIGSSREGYFICRTAEELEGTIEHLKGRVRGIKRAINGLYKAKYGGIAKGAEENAQELAEPKRD